MRAFVLKAAGSLPVLDSFPDPEIKDKDQQVIKVIAAALNPIDRYITNNEGPVLPRVVGIEGIGVTEDGQRVYFDGPVPPYGSIAEKVLVNTDSLINLPEGLQPEDALAVGISGLAGWLPLSWKAKLQTGESVLVLGATGAQGQISVQAAKIMGAVHVTAAGRNKDVLENLKSKGADSIAYLEGDLIEAIKSAAPEGGYDVVIDSLFGEPFEALIKSGTLGSESRIVTLGGAAGHDVNLNFREYQSTRGAAFSAYSTFYVPVDLKKEAYLEMVKNILEGKLKIAYEEFPLDQADKAFAKQAEGPHKKIIIKP